MEIAEQRPQQAVDHCLSVPGWLLYLSSYVHGGLDWNSSNTGSDYDSLRAQKESGTVSWVRVGTFP